MGGVLCNESVNVRESTNKAIVMPEIIAALPQNDLANAYTRAASISVHTV